MSEVHSQPTQSDPVRVELDPKHLRSAIIRQLLATLANQGATPTITITVGPGEADPAEIAPTIEELTIQVGQTPQKLQRLGTPTVKNIVRIILDLLDLKGPTNAKFAQSMVRDEAEVRLKAHKSTVSRVLSLLGEHGYIRLVSQTRRKEYLVVNRTKLEELLRAKNSPGTSRLGNKPARG